MSTEARGAIRAPGAAGETPHNRAGVGDDPRDPGGTGAASHGAGYAAPAGLSLATHLLGPRGRAVMRRALLPLRTRVVFAGILTSGWRLTDAPPAEAQQELAAPHPH